MASADPQFVTVSATKVTLRRRPWLAAALGWGSLLLANLPLIVIAVGAVVAGGGAKPWWAEVMVGASWLGALVSGAAALAASVSWTQQTTLSVADGTLTMTSMAPIMRRKQVPVADIVNGTVIPGMGATLELNTGGTIDVELADPREAERLVAACELSAEERRFRTRFRASPWRPALAGMGAIGLYALAMRLAPKPSMLTAFDAALLAVSALAGLGTLLLATRPPRIEVGADGVWIRRKLASRFVRFEDLRSAKLIDPPSEARGVKLVLERHDGESEAITARRAHATEVRALHRRIELGLAAHAEAPEAPVRLALLDRRQRPLAAWRADLDGLVRDDAGYRASPLSRDDVEAILAAPNTSTEHRIGAAYALQSLDGGEASPRIRIAAETCAEPGARDALLRIAAQDHEHAAVQEALAAEGADRSREQVAAT